jgi:hypothetical protein
MNTTGAFQQSRRNRIGCIPQSAGDMNFDGLVDAQDYGTIDNWVQFPGTDGYANGDLNYDGVIDAADYGIIDNTIQLQGPPLPV